ncbi:hypothetical protein FDZ61_01830 [Ehrlichia ruminantium]|uniref:hypothetical protein n=1 Tax=Ehrlichia ruminantium TaxID=779 RepID=UPI0015DC4F7B|nr:hypothetical protein [Ehrlichia ruminantium]QLK55919.1 hypothetical protein FDZ61_01830 [Ehrlichia ruminantium]QLK56833.1 hypothetical protein FDZ60_01820 [Ehrlichia ruminantium]
MLGNSQESSISSETLEIFADSQIHITEEQLKIYIKNLIDNLYVYNLLDPGNAIPLSIIAMLGLHSDFHSFKKAVLDTLSGYKNSVHSFLAESTIIDRSESLRAEPNHCLYSLPPLLDKRTSEDMWNDIKELHILYHQYIINVSVDKSTNAISNTVNAPGTKTCSIKISYTNPLRQHVHYFTLKTLIEYYNTQQTSLTGHRSIDDQQEAAVTLFKETLEEKFCKGLKNKIFFNYAQYLKSLFTIVTSNPKVDYTLPQNIYRYCETRRMVISKITHDIIPISDPGTDIRIYCDIPEYVTVLSETSNITIYGKEVLGKVYSIYGTIIIKNNMPHNEREISSRICSLFGRVIINGRILNRKHTIPSIFEINNHNTYLSLKYNSILTKITSSSVGSVNEEKKSQIFEISRDTILNSTNYQRNISNLKIELHNPDEQLTATVISLDLKDHPLPITNNNTIPNILSLTDNHATDSELPSEFFSNNVNPKSAGITRIKNTIIIEKLTPTIGRYMNVATKNGTVLDKYGITEVIIQSTRNFVILLLHDANVTIECPFSGEIFTNTGNITVIGPVTHNSKLISNFGSVYVGNISHRSNALAIDNSRIVSSLGHVTIYGKVSKSNITTSTSDAISIHNSISWFDKLTSCNTKTLASRKT